MDIFVSHLFVDEHSSENLAHDFAIHIREAEIATEMS